MKTKESVVKTKGKAGESSVSYATVKSPIGDLLLVADDSALIGLYFSGRKHVPAKSKQWTLNVQHPVLRMAAKQLEEYFEGKRKEFTLPLRFAGTEFQQKVWQEIARIPYGKTVTYTDLAERAGAPQAVRAAGTTTGRNPISIIVPCHRVVGKNGDLCGFAGGLEKKIHLLGLEDSDAKRAKKKAVL